MGPPRAGNGNRSICLIVKVFDRVCARDKSNKLEETEGVCKAA